jgi:hypothetical protein
MRAEISVTFKFVSSGAAAGVAAAFGAPLEEPDCSVSWRTISHCILFTTMFVDNVMLISEHTACAYRH